MIRIFVRENLVPGVHIGINKEQIHYLFTVMRCRDGDNVRVFNQTDGEWLAQIIAMGKRDVHLHIRYILRSAPPAASAKLTLFFPPLRSNRLGWLVEKLTEVGVDIMQPVITERSITDKTNVTRMEAIVIEAAEQSERLSIPEVREQIYFADIFDSHDISAVPIILLHPQADKIINEVLDTLPIADCALMLGPEGGLSDQELLLCRNRPNVHLVSMGANILRAETAAICGAFAIKLHLGQD
jgi:16S rRNA (uracil1498-N3)-methyltransferase